jgi:hypothetical protein
MKYDPSAIQQLDGSAQRSSDLHDTWRRAVEAASGWTRDHRAAHLDLGFSNLGDSHSVEATVATVKLRMHMGLCMTDKHVLRGRIDFYEVLQLGEDKERRLCFLTFNLSGDTDLQPDQGSGRIVGLWQLPEIVASVARDVLLERGEVRA